MTRREPSDEARMQRRHAERCCSGSDGGYVKRERMVLSQAGGHQQLVAVHDTDAEERAGKRIHNALVKWHVHLLDFAGNLSGVMYPAETISEPSSLTGGDIAVALEGDPRGAVLKVRLPGEAEAVSV